MVLRSRDKTLSSPHRRASFVARIILSANGARANFGFVIQLAPGASAPKGNLAYQDQDAERAHQGHVL